MPYLDETEKLNVCTALTLKAVLLNDQQQKTVQVRDLVLPVLTCFQVNMPFNIQF